MITDGKETIAESGAILEYLVERFGAQAQGELAHLQPAPGTPEYRQSRFWMHYAEGSLMNWLVMKLVFMTIPKQPMPFFVRPIARTALRTGAGQAGRPERGDGPVFHGVAPGEHAWFAGDHISIADFQMSFPVEAALARAANADRYPKLAAYKARMVARPAYQRALAKGGPVVMS